MNTLLLMALILAFCLFEFIDGYPAFVPIEPTAIVAVVLTLGAALLRSRAPWVFLAVTTALNFYYTLELSTSPPGWGVLVALPFAMYAVAATVSARTAILAAVAVELLLVVTAAVERDVTFPNIYPVTLTAFLATSLAAGRLTALRHRLMESTRRRAAEAERTREALASTRVAEQRLSTARDLHDVVGHEVAVINLQAGAARRRVRQSPEEAEASLELIEQSAGRILSEIAALLKDLRSGPPSDEGATSGLLAVPALVRTLAAGGFPIEYHAEAALPELDPAVDDAAYRILEEALVNAYKHGAPGEPATATVAQRDTDLVITVANPTSDSASDTETNGLGLVGMAERASAVGGTVDATLEDGVFTLAARIPLAGA
ncbi:two-component sensor histidine kinase [Agromyces mangrovi Wang et al. 2018]|nr:two-component sensor histidine kinase [Agromyces mangrovi]